MSPYRVQHPKWWMRNRQDRCAMEWWRRSLVVVNLLLVPYIAVRFPRELRSYLRGCWRVIVHG